MNNKLILSITVFGLLFIGLVITLSYFFDQFLPNFLSDFLATLAGVALGIPVALLINRYQEEKSREEKVFKMLVVLGDELLKNKDMLANWEELFERYWSAGISAAMIKDDVWRAFSDGGELQWISDPILLTSLANAYYGIRSVRELATLYSTFSR